MVRPVHGGNLAWAAQLACCPPDELLDFSASISPLGPPASVLQAIQAAFSSMVAYPDPAYSKLSSAIAQHHQIPIDYILPGNGAAELLNWAARDLATQTRCFCLSPGFSDYARALKAFGGTLSPIPLFNSQGQYMANWENIEDWENTEDWETALQKSEDPHKDLSQCGFLLNNPHNPTGALFTREKVRSLIPRFAQVVVDEAFMDFLPAEREQSVIDWVCEFPNLVVIRSLTKFYTLPGLRLGYAIAHPQTLQRWQQWRDAWPVNTLAAAAGIAALKDRAFAQRTWEWVMAESDYLFQALQRLPGLTPLPSCANFFLVRCDRSATALQLQLLQRHQVYIRDCISFAELGDRYFRVAVKTRTDNQRLLQALADVLPTLDLLPKDLLTPLAAEKHDVG
ncbi:MAG: threonine-phosphate decarboxylase CobD [Phormidesmis sp.]